MSAIIPDGGYQTVTAYLILRDAAGFLEFVQQVFNAKVGDKHLGENGAIVHASVKIGNSDVMVAEATAEYPPQPAGFFIYVGDADHAWAAALNYGAAAVTPVANQSYGRSGGVKDAFGNTWWITAPL